MRTATTETLVDSPSENITLGHQVSDKPKPRHLLLSRGFAPLFWTQFFASFADNFVKNTVIILIFATVANKQDANGLITLTAAVFALPFLLFSALGGQLADRFDKARLARLLKFCEIFAALLAALGLLFSSVPVMMAAFFLFGVSSALFGPVKYSVLPEQIEQSGLPRANAWIEGATFIAILTGTILAPYTFSSHDGPQYLSAFLIVGFAIIAWIFSRFMPYHGSAKRDLAIDRNILRSTVKLVKEIARDRKLLTVSLMVSWFWLVGTIMLSVIPALTDQLGGFHRGMAYFLTIFAVAVAAGSAIAAWLSAGRIVLLQSVVGTFICGLITLDLAFTMKALPNVAAVTSYNEFLMLPGVFHISIDLALIAMSGAFLVVPGFAALQAWATPDHRARVIGANNIINSAVMVLGAGIVAVLQKGGIAGITFFSPAPLYIIVLLLGAASIIASFVMLRFLPTNPFRDFVSILFRAFFRLEVDGIENLKNAGEAPILALNHVSFLDGLLALAVSDTTTMRTPAFAIHSDVARRWWVRPFLKFMNAFPMDPTRPLAARSLIRTVRSGSPLVIFPEGRITVTGGLMKVYDGAAMVADRTGSQVVPIKIDGLERTFFSRLNGIQTRRQLFPKVKVTITAPITLELDPELKARARRQAAGNELYRIMSDLVFATSGKRNGTVLEEVVKAGHDYGMRHDALDDPITHIISYGRMLTGVRALARRFKLHLHSQKHVGFMLPNSNAAAITFLALQSAGKIPAMMNFSAGLATLEAAIAATDIHVIITARAFLRQARLEDTAEKLKENGVRFLYLEDLKKEISLPALVAARLQRSKPVVKDVKRSDAAAILFTSGSEGLPKGVVLTHANMLSNAAQAAARVDFNSADKVFNVLPMFHSFGLTAATILPLVYGVPVYFYPSPLHYRVVPEAIYSSNATIIFGTDTFLNGYGRNAHAYDLRSIRYCFAGAEPVKAATREMMMNKFGIRILEGYGVTEAAPVIALNTPMYNKLGSVGKLMPGITPRLEPVDGVDEGGRLYIKGPNIMAGYLRVENPSVIEAPEDGWHDTGDIVSIDNEGFVTILGRAKRFAKIGGEMVSLSAVEALAARAYPDIALGVVAIFDAKKGERLVLVAEDEGVTRPQLLQFARQAGVPELFVPSKIITAKLPLLATGKIDYPALKAIADMA